MYSILLLSTMVLMFFAGVWIGLCIGENQFKKQLSELTAEIIKQDVEQRLITQTAYELAQLCIKLKANMPKDDEPPAIEPPA